MKLASFVSLLCAPLAAPLYGQGNPGAIGGVLHDPNGNFVTGTEGSVQLRDTASQKVYTAVISAKGDFLVSGLPAGSYDLTVPMACCMYGTYSQKGVALAAGQTLKMEIHMPWNINLGTIGDDPVMLMNDMRARAKNIAGPTPRTADGKPDFSGMWAQVTLPGVPLQAPLPLKPWAAEIQQRILQRAKGDINALNPAAFCMPQNALQITLPFQFKLIQTPTLMIHLTEFQTPGYRQIFLDGRGHPQDFNPSWVGHSIGKWEGDTLVVESVSFNDMTAGVGVHSDKLRVIERFQRPDLGHLQVDITLEDEEAYLAPVKRAVRATLIPQEEILEFVCAENNKDPLHFGGLGYAGGR